MCISPHTYKSYILSYETSREQNKSLCRVLLYSRNVLRQYITLYCVYNIIQSNDTALASGLTWCRIIVDELLNVCGRPQSSSFRNDYFIVPVRFERFRTLHQKTVTRLYIIMINECIKTTRACTVSLPNPYDIFFVVRGINNVMLKVSGVCGRYNVTRCRAGFDNIRDAKYRVSLVRALCSR